MKIAVTFYVSNEARQAFAIKELERGRPATYQEMKELIITLVGSVLEQYEQDYQDYLEEITQEMSNE